MLLVISLRRRAMALRPSISGSNAVPFVIRERCLLERRPTRAGSADELRAAFLAFFGGSVATRHIAPDLPRMRADAVMNVLIIFPRAFLEDFICELLSFADGRGNRKGAPVAGAPSAFSSGGFACLAPFGGGFLRDQSARADRHLARAKAQVPHFEIHGLRDPVRPAKLRDAEG